MNAPMSMQVVPSQTRCEMMRDNSDAITRSTTHRGLDEALQLFHAAALLELGMECGDGTGATLAWPLVRCAAALLTEVQDLPDGAIHSRPSDLRDTGSSNPGALHTGPRRTTLGSKY